MRRMLFMNLYTMVYAASNGSEFANSREINSIIPEDLNPISENIEAFQPTASGHNQMPVFNCKPMDATECNAMCNPFVGRNDEVETVLNSMFFSILKRNISFILYNISTLREIFATIEEKQKNSELNISRFTDLLYSFSDVFIIYMLRNAFEEYPKTKKNQSYLHLRCFRHFLRVRNIECQNLPFSALKEKIQSTSELFRMNDHDFLSKYNLAKDMAMEIMDEYLFFSSESKSLITLELCSLIYDLAMSFHLTISTPLMRTSYPVMSDTASLFRLAFDLISNLLNSQLASTFCDKRPSYFLFSDIQWLSYFIYSIFKTVQNNHENSIFLHSIFLIQDSAFPSIFAKFFCKNSSSIKLTSSLTDIFIELMNKIDQKRAQINQATNFFIEMNATVHNFLKTLIITLKSSHSNCDLPDIKLNPD